MTVVAIVDDDRSHRVALARLLRASGIDSLSFASAEEYLERERASRVDCLVLDIQLGGISGFELQRRLASAGAGPPVVFLTAHDEPETIEQASRTGCAYLRKTDPGRSVIEAIRRAVEAGPACPKGQ